MRDIESNRGYTTAVLFSSSPCYSGRTRLPYFQNDESSTTHVIVPSRKPSPTRQSKLPLASRRLIASLFPMAIMMCLALVVIMYLQIERLNPPSIIPIIIAHSISKPTTIIFRQSDDSPSLPSLSRLEPLQAKDEEERDYGNLILDFFQDDDTAHRQIYQDYMMDQSQNIQLPGEEEDDDWIAPYYAFDDDAMRGERTNLYRGVETETEGPCRRISEHRANFPNCNRFHEQQLLEKGIRFLGEGAFREVFGLEHSFKQDEEKFVLKELRFDEDVDDENYEFIRMDAAIAERLSSSPRVFDIYGYCGVGILSEFFYHGDMEEFAYDDEGEVSQDLRGHEELVVQNSLSGRQKLVLALEMAEGIALLHGYSGGVIVHDDIQLSQFLLNKDKTLLKINDFNRAEFMLYDDVNQSYCKYHNGNGAGRWRSPEEYKNEGLNEKIDVWSLGNNMYTLLTGLDPFSWLISDDMKPLVKLGETAYIDPRFWTRSKEEGRLAKIIKQCFEYNPNLRPSAFEIVDQLTKAVAESLGENMTRAEVLQGLSE